MAAEAWLAIYGREEDAAGAVAAMRAGWGEYVASLTDVPGGFDPDAIQAVIEEMESVLLRQYRGTIATTPAAGMPGPGPSRPGR